MEICIVNRQSLIANRVTCGAMNSNCSLVLMICLRKREFFKSNLGNCLWHPLWTESSEKGKIINTQVPLIASIVSWVDVAFLTMAFSSGHIHMVIS